MVQRSKSRLVKIALAAALSLPATAIAQKEILPPLSDSHRAFYHEIIDLLQQSKKYYTIDSSTKEIELRAGNAHELKQTLDEAARSFTPEAVIEGKRRAFEDMVGDSVRLFRGDDITEDQLDEYFRGIATILDVEQPGSALECLRNEAVGVLNQFLKTGENYWSRNAIANYLEMGKKLEEHIASDRAAWREYVLSEYVNAFELLYHGEKTERSFYFFRDAVPFLFSSGLVDAESFSSPFSKTVDYVLSLSSLALDDPEYDRAPIALAMVCKVSHGVSRIVRSTKDVRWGAVHGALETAMDSLSFSCDMMNEDLVKGADTEKLKRDINEIRTLLPY